MTLSQAMVELTDDDWSLVALQLTRQYRTRCLSSLRLVSHRYARIVTASYVYDTVAKLHTAIPYRPELFLLSPGLIIDPIQFVCREDHSYPTPLTTKTWKVATMTTAERKFDVSVGWDAAEGRFRERVWFLWEGHCVNIIAPL